MKHRFLVAALAFAAVTGCAGNAPHIAETGSTANAQAIEAHMQFLASDALAGRETASKEHEIASLYIASQLQALGLEPAGEHGSYFQRVPMRKARLAQDSAKFVLHVDGKSTALAYPKAFFTGPSMQYTQTDVTAPMVFAGYGLVSTEFGLDDYAGLDVEGKIVVILTGRPDSLPSEEAAHLNSLKTRLAAERGAVGVVTIHTPKQEKSRPYANSLLYLTAPGMEWLQADGSPADSYPNLKAGAYVHPDAAAALFAKAPLSLADIFTQLENKQNPKGFDLAVSATLQRTSSHEEISSPNVIAVLPGSDPVLKNEYVVVTAHSDHIGLSNDLRSDDKINNGAMDNAAGVAILLETARLFAQLPEAPKRSILFVVVTGEEKGLLGADYFANNPTRPIEALVGNVNLDMPVLLYPFADMIAFGANHSSLGKVVEQAAAKEGIALSADPMPEQAIFTRSDHYTLVKQGVPAVFLMTGFKSKDPNQDGGKIWGSFFAKHYHKPSDDIASLTKEYGPIRYDAGAVFTNINFNIALDIANTEQRPYWLKDSFFNGVFGKSYNREAVK
ncbi:M28 family metallopeptidase [Rheinheimera baltica]|uniref:M28 family metallopeptidase n=1 Tax=Rheinheimera baltica TaxID=67576 RepID=A0ABT9I1F9_9GAMM|nr:M28 family metallopeptidase [Rheinheimera baltica]MDP5137227.1 M28 family metallopeptidase [Rheinheimera baltica]MDP5143236.1 M28 family metallopeptidase [Rheinheimera baltica]MDP5190074.1 M28 family metallopeptidase [Rheinheimera baltica]